MPLQTILWSSMAGNSIYNRSRNRWPSMGRQRGGVNMAVHATRILAVVLFLSSVLQAQMTRGILVGTITDPSGAHVAGAQVNITDEARNTTSRVTTSPDGQYTATNLEPGT